MLRYKTNLDLV